MNGVVTHRSKPLRPLRGHRARVPRLTTKHNCLRKPPGWPAKIPTGFGTPWCIPKTSIKQSISGRSRPRHRRHLRVLLRMTRARKRPESPRAYTLKSNPFSIMDSLDGPSSACWLKPHHEPRLSTPRKVARLRASGSYWRRCRQTRNDHRLFDGA